MSSLDFPILLSIGQSSKCCQTNPLYAGKDKLPVEHEKLIGLDLSAQNHLLKNWVYAYIRVCMCSFDTVQIRTNTCSTNFSFLSH